MTEKDRKHSNRQYRKMGAFFGFLLGLGAPLGWLVWQYIYGQRMILIPWVRSQFFESGQIYAYMAVATTIAFTLFGYFLGRTNDVLKDQSIVLKDTLDETNAMAFTDALTGVHNARYIHDHLIMEMESAKRYETPLTCLMCDIDDFKKINDTYGHPAGDVVLKTLAKTVLRCIRRVDMLGRLGGEEFLVIMPHTSSETAFAIAERIRQAVQRWPFVDHELKIPVSISIGVAFYPARGIVNKEDLLKSVDEALYQAKRTGKNKTVLMEGVIAN